MKFRFLDIEITVSYLFLSLLTLLILIDKTAMISVSVLAVVLHEIGHIIAMSLLKIKVVSIDFLVSAVKVNTGEMLNHKINMIVAVSGPLVNLIFSAFLYSKIELLVYFGAANLILFIFNMIPVKGLDGGDALYFLLMTTNFKAVEKVRTIVSLISIVLMILAGGYLFYETRSNLTLMLVGIYLLILNFRKI